MLIGSVTTSISTPILNTVLFATGTRISQDLDWPQSLNQFFNVVQYHICTDLPKALKRDSIYNIDMLF